MKKMNILLIMSLIIIALVGCNEKSIDFEKSADSQFVEYGVAGEIVEIEDDASDDTLLILVKGDENNGATYTEGWVTVNESTKIYKSEKVAMAALEKNMYVNVFFDGPVAESFPVQGTAKQINIIEKNDNNDSQPDE